MKGINMLDHIWSQIMRCSNYNDLNYCAPIVLWDGFTTVFWEVPYLQYIWISVCHAPARFLNRQNLKVYICLCFKKLGLEWFYNIKLRVIEVPWLSRTFQPKRKKISKRKQLTTVTYRTPKVIVLYPSPFILFSRLPSINPKFSTLVQVVL